MSVQIEDNVNTQLMKEMTVLFKTLDLNPTVKVGVQPPESKQPKKKDKGKLSKSQLLIVALTHEFGTKKAGRNRKVTIPQRSFIRSTYDENIEKYLKLIVKGLGKATNSDNPKKMALRTLTLTGELFVGDIVHKIRKRIAPALAESTIEDKRRESGTVETTPLLRTSQLVNSIRAVLEQEE